MAHMANATAKQSGHRAAHLYGALGVITALAVLAGFVTVSPLSHRQTANVRLTGDSATSPLGDGTALILGPTNIPFPSEAYVDTADQNYLEPLGFTGTALALPTPESACCTDTVLGVDASILEAEVNALIAQGGVSAENPIVIFAYSQSTAAAAEAAQELHAQGVPADDLHFVLVGDSASPYGGILNSGWLDSVPSWLLSLADLNTSIDLATPNYYPTDVYTIQNDFYAGEPQGFNLFTELLNNFGQVITDLLYHEDYLGLSAEQIQGATLSETSGLANYYTIADNAFDPTTASWNALVNSGQVGGTVDYNDVLTVFNDLANSDYSGNFLLDVEILLSALGL